MSKVVSLVVAGHALSMLDVVLRKMFVVGQTLFMLDVVWKMRGCLERSGQLAGTTQHLSKCN